MRSLQRATGITAVVTIVARANPSDRPARPMQGGEPDDRIPEPFRDFFRGFPRPDGPGGPGGPIGRSAAAPFILATPHHALAGAASEAQGQLTQIQQALSAYQQAHAAGQLDEEGMQQFQQLYDAYLALTGQR